MSKPTKSVFTIDTGSDEAAWDLACAVAMTLSLEGYDALAHQRRNPRGVETTAPRTAFEKALKAKSEAAETLRNEAAGRASRRW